MDRQVHARAMARGQRMQVLFLPESVTYTSDALGWRIAYDAIFGWNLADDSGQVLRYLHRDEVHDLVFDPENRFTHMGEVREHDGGRSPWT